jgi:hypothetical protein
MTPTLFPEPQVGDCCPWEAPAFKKIGRHSRLHIIARRLAAGMHPLGHAKLAGNSETCGTCSHVRIRQLGGRYIKCRMVPMTGGPASDVRLKWPACVHWCPGPVR